MESRKERKPSKFMDWGGRYEATMSHFVAWTLMCASEEGAEEYGKKLSNYSKEILFFLLFGKENFRKELENCSIESVKIWREWERTDILAEITFSNDKKYALFIEIKAYSNTNERQLERYKTACERYDYKGKGFEEKFVLLGAWENDSYSDAEKQRCDAYGFSIYTFQDILESIFTKGETTFESSGNELFDEFWAGKW